MRSLMTLAPSQLWVKRLQNIHLQDGIITQQWCCAHQKGVIRGSYGCWAQEIELSWWCDDHQIGIDQSMHLTYACAVSVTRKSMSNMMKNNQANSNEHLFEMWTWIMGIAFGMQIAVHSMLQINAICVIIWMGKVCPQQTQSV